MKKEEKYKEVRIMNLPNTVAKIYIPDLTDDERERRMQKIYSASAALVNCRTITA